MTVYDTGLQNLERPSHVKFNTHETDTPINQHRDFTTHPPLLEWESDLAHA